MKNYYYYSVLIVLLFTIILNAQTVTGKLVDENGGGLVGVQLQLYTSTNVYEDSSSSDGTFSFNIITDVEENQLPTGYSVSDNFPNPFNPRTRINITLPDRENVKVEVFNLLGQSVADVIKQTFDAGTNNIDIELNGLPNGFYISRITIGDKYTVVKKLMLIYGSQHLLTSGSAITSQLNKSNNNYLDTTLDSLVATSLIIGRKTFTSLPNFVSGTLELGNLIIERYCPGTSTILYEGKTYHTVQIGNQCWLKENLDVGTMINGSTQADSMRNNGILEKYCYNNDTANCSTYGGLYQWNEAMQYVTEEGAKGICPTGWHLPILTEFETLSSAVGGDGNALKEIGQGTGGGAGTNTSGFSALLAGKRNYNGGFTTLGDFAIFWSSTDTGATIVNYLYLYFNDSNIYLNYRTKGDGLSVRCLKGVGTVPQAPILQSPTDGVTNVSIPAVVSWYPSNGATSYIIQVSTTYTFNTFIFNENIGNVLSNQLNGLNTSTQYYWRVYAVNSFGTSDPSSIWSFTTVSGGGGTPCPGDTTITDPRDGKVYNTVLIGTQCWLKENLDIGTRINGSLSQTNNSTIEKYCYNDDPANCTTYGGLYQWNEAMQYVTNEGVQGICPTGWHLPTITEFDTLSSAVGYDGNALKREDQAIGQPGQGTNTSGFSALLAGHRNDDGYFYDLGIVGDFWSSTEDDATLAYGKGVYYNVSNIGLVYYYKEGGLSVRCVKD
jgi:uncharacterized protein (TIGR02145 family)